MVRRKIAILGNVLNPTGDEYSGEQCGDGKHLSSQKRRRRRRRRRRMLPKKPRLGFQSAAAVLVAGVSVVSPAAKSPARANCDEAPRPMAAGFHSAAAVLSNPVLVDVPVFSTTNNEFDEKDHCPLPQHPPQDDSCLFVRCVGWPYHAHGHDHQKPSAGTTVSLRREPRNDYDGNAISVNLLGTTTRSSSITKTHKIGYVSKEQASILAPAMDDQQETGVDIRSTCIERVYESSFLLRLHVTIGNRGLVAALETLASRGAGSSSNPTRSGRSMSAATRTAYMNILQRDLEQAAAAGYRIDELEVLPWKPVGSTVTTSTTQAAATIPALIQSNPRNRILIAPSQSWQDIQECQCWPPPDTILEQLGMAPAKDEVWWRETAGLLPPAEWKVTGASDVTPKLKGLSVMERKLAGETLDGAIHGVTNVWHPETMAAVTTLMETPNFWCRRSFDALIRAFGGPYVLGQHEDNLVLVHGAPHTVLTEKMCRAHNLVYTIVHLVPPIAPGFNTIIFGANLRGAGFHYHQDAVSSLKAKNACLMPRQPVVTTVVYQKPEMDNGKEVVLWKPLLNFRAGSSSSQCELYHAARALSTTQGLMHIQQAGLQSKACHGVFHTPNDTNPRQGYRVAITARVSKVDAAAIAQEFFQKGSYCQEYGPDGDTPGLGGVSG